jgi:hypothetical protein
VWGLLSDLWELLLRLLVGHGYRPGRVLWILVVLTLVVGATFRLPVARDLMRATDEGTVYTVSGRWGRRRPEPRPVTRVEGAPCGASMRRSTPSTRWSP